MANDDPTRGEPSPKGLPEAETLHPRVLAHLGDSAFELFVRERALRAGLGQIEEVHAFTTARVSGAFQVRLLAALKPHLSEAEAEIVRRGRNVPVSVGRRSQHATHRQATGFEALIGFLFLKTPPRLHALWEILAPYIDDPSRLGDLG